MTDKLVLVDLSGIAHPIYHANANDSNPNATSIAIVERIRAMCSAHPHAAICCDSGRSFRRDIDPTYKANRIDGDKDAERARIQHQITLATEILRGDGFPVWSVKGFEADDLIATAVRLATTNSGLDSEACRWCGGPHVGGPEFCNVHVLIIAADKDLRQLVSERVDVFAPGIADRPSVTYDVAGVVAKHGVQPHQLLDYLALVGDTSDNIKGAKGIGEKTAASLLNTFGNLDDLFAAIDEGKAAIKPAGLASLAEFRPRMETVRSLIRLRTDVPIPFEEIFKERVPQDVAVFGGEEMDETDGGVAEVEDALGQAEVVAAPEAETSASLTATVAGSNPAPATTSTQVARRPEVIEAPAPAEWERQLEPRSMSQAIQLSQLLFASKLQFSSQGGYANHAAVLSTLLAGRELGLPPMASMRAFHIIENKPAQSADLIRALVIKSTQCEYFRIVERDAQKATWATKRKGDPEVRLTYTIEEGRAAWQKDQRAWDASSWGKRPANMLTKTASSTLARMVYPDVVMNMYSGEEFSDGE